MPFYLMIQPCHNNSIISITVDSNHTETCRNLHIIIVALWLYNLESIYGHFWVIFQVSIQELNGKEMGIFLSKSKLIWWLSRESDTSLDHVESLQFLEFPFLGYGNEMHLKNLSVTGKFNWFVNMLTKVFTFNWNSLFSSSRNDWRQ